MRHLILYILFLILSGYSFAQDVVLHERPDADTALGKSGPNLKFFNHIYFGFGEILGYAEDNSSNIKYWQSPYYTYGFKYKIKANATFSFTGDLFYTNYIYTVEQAPSKRLPDKVLHDHEIIRLYSGGLAIYCRINFDKKRGNYMGRFLELGVLGEYNFYNNHITRDKLNDGIIRKVYRANPNYINPFRAAISGQLGFNKYIFFFNCFVTDLFTKDSQLAEMPNFVTGIKIGLHK